MIFFNSLSVVLLATSSDGFAAMGEVKVDVVLVLVVLVQQLCHATYQMRITLRKQTLSLS